MLKINNILETKGVFESLQKRGLLNQYKKAKKYILSGIYGKTDFKLRQPKEKGEWSFRINKQYRAFGKIDGEDLIIFLIDNHQNF